ncbi:MAG: hypothetical protein ACOCQQ_00105 [Candidatus Nanoarchaeia archaeon]
MNQKAPIFVKLDDYKKVMSSVDTVKKQIVQIKKTLEKIDGLREKEQQELIDWKDNVSRVQEEISFVDNALFEPDHS